MKKSMAEVTTFLLILCFVMLFPLPGSGATRREATDSKPAEKCQITASSANRQTKQAAAKKTSYRHNRTKAVGRKQAALSQRTPKKICRPIYARSLDELQGPLPDIVAAEICKLRDTHHLLNTDDISIHIHDLGKDETLVNIKADRVRNAASLIKPFVMLTVYDLASQNKLCLTDSTETQIYRMITVSSNESTNSLIRLVGAGNTMRGLEKINATIKKYGFRDTYLVEDIPEGGRTYRNRTSAYDLSEFFRRIYKRSIISPHYSQKMIDVLLDNHVHRIETPVLVQDGVPVADKTGYVCGTNGDSGIVFLRNINRNASDYVVSIIIENPYRPTNGWGKRKTEVIRHLSNLIYSYFRQQQVFHTARTTASKG
jgi:beta-lactamase class A